jgi:hypothetical protein
MKNPTTARDLLVHLIGEAGQAETDPRCDFCSQRGIRWLYQTPDEPLYGVADETASFIAQSVGGWAACDPCHALIGQALASPKVKGQGAWNEMADRFFDVSPVAHNMLPKDRIRLRQHVLAMWDGLHLADVPCRRIES